MPFNYTGAAGYNTAPPSYMSPIMMALLGMDTSRAQQGQKFNTGTGQWETPPADWAALGGGRMGPAGVPPTGGPNAYLGPGGQGGGPLPPGGPPKPNMPRVDVVTKPYQVSGPGFNNEIATDPATELGGEQSTFGTNPPTTGAGAGGLGYGSGQGDFFGLLSHLQGLMRGSGGASSPNQPISGTGGANPWLDGRGAPITGSGAAGTGAIPQTGGGNLNTSGLGLANLSTMYPYSTSQMIPGTTAGQNPVDSPDLQQTWNDQGDYGLKSMSMGNRPGMRSPMGPTGGAFQHTGPRGYQGY